MSTTLLHRRAAAPTILSFGVVLCALVLFAAGAGQARAASLGCDGKQGTFFVDWTAISDGSGAAGAPSTDGSTVVWADDRSGNFDIFAYDLESGEERTVTDAPGDQTDPVVADGQVYWVDHRGSAPTIWTLDPDTEQPLQLSGPGADKVAASDCFVAWSQDSGTDTGYDIAGAYAGCDESVDVCSAPGDQVNPTVSSDLVAWEDHRGANADIYAFGLESQNVFPVCEARGDQTTPSAYGCVVVWADDRSGDSDLYGADTCELWQGDGDHWRKITRVLRCDNEKRTEFIVNDGPGDQTQPAISGPMVYYTQTGNGANGADIMGLDLSGGDPFVVSDGDGPQTNAASGCNGDYVAWRDAGGDKTPVVAGGWLDWKEGGDKPGPIDEWTTDTVVTLFLSVFSDYGVFDEVRFAVDDGVYGDWQSLSDTENVQIPDHQGAHVIHIQLADSGIAAGDIGSESNPFEFSVSTILDQQGPSTAAATARVVAHHGAKATVKLKIKDNLSPKADVALRIKDHAGKVVQVVKLGQVATRKVVRSKFTVTLKRGHYTFRVVASDLAGNAQRKAGLGRLIVK